MSTALFGRRSASHTTVNEYRLIFDSESFGRYFKFTFVRNPWDRLYSAYRFLQGGGYNARDRTWAEVNLSAYTSFSDFVERWVSSESVWSYVHFLPQYHFVCGGRDPQPLLDFVGRFENLRGDFSTVLQRIGSPDDPGLPHLNPTKRGRRDFRLAYSPAARAIVEEVYARDIELFGYRFEPTRDESSDPDA